MTLPPAAETKAGESAHAHCACKGSSRRILRRLRYAPHRREGEREVLTIGRPGWRRYDTFVVSQSRLRPIGERPHPQVAFAALPVGHAGIVAAHEHDARAVRREDDVVLGRRCCPQRLRLLAGRSRNLPQITGMNEQQRMPILCP